MRSGYDVYTRCLFDRATYNGEQERRVKSPSECEIGVVFDVDRDVALGLRECICCKLGGNSL